jgi:hypothetical protein
MFFHEVVVLKQHKMLVPQEFGSLFPRLPCPLDL